MPAPPSKPSEKRFNALAEVEPVRSVVKVHLERNFVDGAAGGAGPQTGGHIGHWWSEQKEGPKAFPEIDAGGGRAPENFCGVTGEVSAGGVEMGFNLGR